MSAGTASSGAGLVLLLLRWLVGLGRQSVGKSRGAWWGYIQFGSEGRVDSWKRTILEASEAPVLCPVGCFPARGESSIDVMACARV